ncbi:TraR/DksA family transcriptional regulator [Streptomyces sp. NPDC059828]|uniref:TraR/DksA family transcriptional regulator n=1 Tax=Streptomyces sp. NPDC059828 TaxID=3346965 RepID=UPI00365BBC66
MVAKKTAVKKTASMRSTAAAGAAAKGMDGNKKSTVATRRPAGGRTPKTGEAGAYAHEATEVRAVAPAKKATRAGSGAAKPEEAKKTATKAAAKTAKTAAGPAKPAKRAGTKAAAKKPPAHKEAAGRPEASTPAAAPKAPAKTKKTAAVGKTAGAGAGKATRTAKEAAKAAKQTGARTVGAKKIVAGATAGGDSTATALATERAAAVPGELAVRPGEDPWAPEEVAEARTELEDELARLRAEISHSEEALTGLMRDSGDGAGDDQADTGTKNITREHEIALANNARDMVEQSERALHRLDTGTYGLCEICGKPIGKARMQAFPRATLCVEDKQKQERRG